jgi:zinc protease
VKKTWTIGQEPKARVSIMFHGDEAWARDKDRDMFLLGQVLSIRLREVLREDMGGVYGVGAGGEISRGPHQQRDFTISFGCAPENVDKLIKATFDEIAAVAKNGIGDEYLEKVKQGFLREREIQLRSNEFWSGWLANSVRYHDDPTIILDPTGMTKRATSANIAAAAKRYLDARQYYQSVLLPAPAK